VGAHFYLELVGAAAQAALTNDHALVLLPSPRRPDVSSASRWTARCSAIRSTTTSGSPCSKPLASRWSRTSATPRTLRSWWVASDNVPNTCELLDHLAEAGARSIALFTVAKAWSWFAEVETAYRDWTARTGLPTIVEAVPGGTSYSGLVAAAGRLLEAHGPDAVLAPPEQLACAALEAARRAGRRVPEDLRVAAAVDGRDAQAAGITALDLMPQVHAQAGVELLLERLAGGAPSVRNVRGHLRVRSSTVELRRG
jgi:DNA-binding LacI/PurR family transcriptional regulator